MTYNFSNKEWPGSLDIPRLIAAAMLFWALTGNPYVYFQILNWVVSLFSILLAIRSYQEKRSLWVWTFAAIAVIFNPIEAFQFPRALWSAIDVIAGLIFVCSIYWMRPKTHQKAASL